MIPSKQIAKSKKCIVSFDRLDDKTPGTQISGEDLFDPDTYFKTDETDVSAHPLRHCSMHVDCLYICVCPKVKVLTVCLHAAQVPGWKKLLDYTIIAVKMDFLRDKLPDGPPTPLPLDDFQNMTEKLQVNDTITVVHYPRPEYERCTNSQHILKIEGGPKEYANCMIVWWEVRSHYLHTTAVNVLTESDIEARTNLKVCPCFSDYHKLCRKILNSHSDDGQPCLTPCFTLNNSDISPSTLTYASLS